LLEPEEFREASELPTIDHPGWNLEHRNQNPLNSRVKAMNLPNFPSPFTH
jgi:hypothetical protein